MCTRFFNTQLCVDDEITVYMYTLQNEMTVKACERYFSR